MFKRTLQILKNLLWYLFIIFIIITLNFMLIRLMPGDPIERYLGVEDYYYLEKYYPKVLEDEKIKYGLDKSIGEQYMIYLRNTISGNWGQSYTYSTTVKNVILSRMKWTILLMLPAVLTSAVLGILIGAFSGWKKDSFFDKSMSSISMILYVIPTYCLSMLLLLAFAYYRNIFPIGGITSGNLYGISKIKDILYHMILPGIVLFLHKTAYNYLIMRNSVVEERCQDYPICARATGLSELQVLYKHVIPNAILPLTTSLATQLGSIVSGVMMIEVIFNWDGMGSLIYKSILKLDYPLLQGCLLITTIMVVLSNIIADVVCYLLDPRVKDGAISEV